MELCVKAVGFDVNDAVIGGAGKEQLDAGFAILCGNDAKACGQIVQRRIGEEKALLCGDDSVHGIPL